MESWQNCLESFITKDFTEIKLNKFFKERTLLNQIYVKDSSFTVAKYLQSIDKNLTVTSYKHVELG